MNHKNLLIFAPEAIIAPHFHTSTYLGWLNKRDGGQSFVYRCNGAQVRCVVKDSVQGVHLWRPEICAECDRRLKIEAETKGLTLVEVPNTPQAEVELRVFSAVKTLSKKSEIAKLTHKGAPIGAISAAQAMHILKKFKNEISTEEEKKFIIEAIVNNICVFDEVSISIEKLKIESLLVFENYAQNYSAILAAKQKGIPWSIVTNPTYRGEDRQRLVVYKHPTPMRREIKKINQSWRDLRINREVVLQALQHVKHTFYAKDAHHYSREKSGKLPDDLVTKIRDKKVVCFFSSSLDEFNANRMYEFAFKESLQPEGIFQDQIAVIKHLAKTLQATHPDVVLIVRIHPREAPNHRERQYSEHYYYLIESLREISESIIVLDPAQAISAYDLFEIIDLGVVGWSTTGFELARLGVPVISPWYLNPSYPPGCGFIDLPSTVEEYERKISEYLSEVESIIHPITRIAYAMRYFIAKSIGTSYDLSSIVPTRNYTGPIAPEPLEDAAQVLAEIFEKNDAADAFSDRRLRNLRFDPVEIKYLTLYVSELIAMFNADQTPSKLLVKLVKIKEVLEVFAGFKLQ